MWNINYCPAGNTAICLAYLYPIQYWPSKYGISGCELHCLARIIFYASLRHQLCRIMISHFDLPQL